nr:uncharacterized protein LOC106028320 [Cavia porcellus]
MEPYFVEQGNSLLPPLGKEGSRAPLSSSTALKDAGKVISVPESSSNFSPSESACRFRALRHRQEGPRYPRWRPPPRPHTARPYIRPLAGWRRRRRASGPNNQQEAQAEPLQTEKASAAHRPPPRRAPAARGPGGGKGQAGDPVSGSEPSSRVPPRGSRLPTPRSGAPLPSSPPPPGERERKAEAGTSKGRREPAAFPARRAGPRPRAYAPGSWVGFRPPSSGSGDA